MGIRKKGVVGTLGLRIRTRRDTMSGVENRMIACVEVIIGDGNGRKWAGVGRLEWLIIRKGRCITFFHMHDMPPAEVESTPPRNFLPIA
ncbi:hypothetical protein Tco_0412058 [Tanacetum coccineum]